MEEGGLDKDLVDGHGHGYGHLCILNAHNTIVSRSGQRGGADEEDGREVVERVVNCMLWFVQKCVDACVDLNRRDDSGATVLDTLLHLVGVPLPTKAEVVKLLCVNCINPRDWVNHPPSPIRNDGGRSNEPIVSTNATGGESLSAMASSDIYRWSNGTGVKCILDGL